MKDKIQTDLATIKMITYENVSNIRFNHTHFGVENLISRKIFYEKQRFSTSC